MGCKHSPLMQILFPNQKQRGVDLGNIEIKESTLNYRKFTLKPKDMTKNAEYFLFYDNESLIYWVVDAQDLPIVKKTRSFLVQQIQAWAQFQTQDVIELLEYIKSIIKDPKQFLPDFIIDQDKPSNSKPAINESDLAESNGCEMVNGGRIL